MEQGTNINTDVLVTTLQNKLAQAAVREAQLEAAVQSLLMQIPNNVPHETEAERASADQSE